ncbi:MAG: N-acetylglucosamine-1-phosphate uridyltransferase [bacterium]|nr:MAG: N-acetylglucosamine-1-phosphate uridyltransferase [bacterium]
MADFFKHDTALVESDQIGLGTRIWAYTHIMRGAKIGEGCNICDHSFIESGAVIGNNVTIKNGVSIWDKVTIEDQVFLGPNVALTNDLWPRSKKADWQVVETLIKQGATIGANATIVCGVSIGQYAMVGAGSVVTRNIPDYGLSYGNPARVCGWVCRCSKKLIFDSNISNCQCGLKYQKIENKVSLLLE